MKWQLQLLIALSIGMSEGSWFMDKFTICVVLLLIMQLFVGSLFYVINTSGNLISIILKLKMVFDKETCFNRYFKP